MYAYLDLLPEVLQDSPEFRAIAAAVDEQAQKLQRRQSTTLLDKRIGSASGDIISRWERVLSLESNPALSLDERRYRILTRIRLRMVMTLRKLREQLSQLTDEGATVSVDYARRLLKVQLALKSKHNHSTVDKLLRETMPANLVIVIEQLYHRWSDYNSCTWRDLSAKTWRQIREEVLE